MRGDPWNKLMDALKKLLEKILDFKSSGATPYVTIINFNQSCRIIYQRTQPENISIARINYGGGGTQFSPIFEKVA